MKLKVRFLNDSGAELIAIFDRESGTVTAQDGRSGTYSRPEGSRLLEIRGAENLTLIFADDIKFEPGFSSRYKGTDGRTGMATILSID